MAWQDYKILGFAPDAPPNTVGALLATQWVVPTDRGFGPIPVITEGASTALNTQSLGGIVVYQTNNTQRIFVGTATKLYEFNSTGSSITDRSDTTYAASTTDTWSFCQFGDVTLAVNKQNILRQINSGGAFAAVGVAPTPKAAIIVTGGPVSAPIVMAFDYDDGTDVFRDGWFASGLTNPLNVTGWTTGTNQCANGRLLDDIPGPITAACAYRDDIIAFKRTGMYIANYTGDATNPWNWRRLSHDIGCIGKNCVVQADDVIYWADDSAIWMYDGSYPRKIPGQAQNYWAFNVGDISGNPVNLNFCRAIWDKQKHLLYILSGIASGPVIWAGVAWNAMSGKWTQLNTVHLTAPVYHILTTANELLWISEVFHARYGVTNNNKLGLMAWTSTATEPHTSALVGWAFTDLVHPPLLNGLRPYWIKSNGTGTWAYGSYSSFASLRAMSVATGSAPSPITVTTLTFTEPGEFHGKMSAKFMTFTFGANAGCDWESSDIVAIDVGAQGKT